MVSAPVGSHWHNKYKRKIVNGVMKEPPYNKHLEGFSTIAQDLTKLGVEVYNVSPNSKIKQFPKITLKEALQL
jgi:hypothetical protein